MKETLHSTSGQSLGTDFYLVDELLTAEERAILFTYEGTDTIQSLIVGREITGEQAFSRH